MATGRKMTMQNLDLFAAAETAPEGARECATASEEERQALARRLYDECQSSKPSWDQLHDVTRGVWLERADRLLEGDPEPWRLRSRG